MDNANANSKELVKRRHPEWVDYRLHWRWLLDSYEGGNTYRYASYGVDNRGLPVRNLIRHKREYPDPREQFSYSPYAAVPGGPGADPNIAATDDDYSLRLARTPVPTFVSEAIDDHLARVYAREVDRQGPASLVDWWEDVDGRGTPIDRWMAGVIAPMFLALGQIDILFDHPAPPDGQEVRSQADVNRLGLGKCIASYILPENVVWWTIDPITLAYIECIVCETHDGDDGKPVIRYRHWTSEDSTLYTDDGKILKTIPHPFGRVPIRRVFDRRRPRCRNVGLPRYEGVAERMREYYNRDSELILSDTTQAHPLLQGPEDYVQEDGSIPIGPAWLLPKKKNNQGNDPSYEGFEVVDFPKDGAESIRRNKQDIRDDVDRDTATAKPAGTDAGTTSQSGVSKAFDHVKLNNKLAAIAERLEHLEESIAEFVLYILGDGKVNPADIDRIDVDYSRQFDLYTPEDFAQVFVDFQAILAASGELPEVEGQALKTLTRLWLAGLSDERYEEMDSSIEKFMDDKAEQKIEQREMLPLPPGGSAPVETKAESWKLPNLDDAPPIGDVANATQASG